MKFHNMTVAIGEQVLYLMLFTSSSFYIITCKGFAQSLFEDYDRTNFVLSCLASWTATATATVVLTNLIKEQEG